MNKEVIKQYPLRLSEELKARVDLLARANSRSTNAEINTLISDGMKYRKLMELNRFTYRKMPFTEKDDAK